MKAGFDNSVLAYRAVFQLFDDLSVPEDQHTRAAYKLLILRAVPNEQLPVLRGSLEQMVHLLFSPDVDALGRVVENDHIGISKQSSRYHHLLLVATRQ